MISAGTSFSISRKPLEAAETAAFQALAHSGAAKADFVFVFFTTDYRDHFDEMLARIREITGTDKVVGSSGFGVLNEDCEIERCPGVAVMTVTSDCLEAVPFLFKDLQENNFHAGSRLGNHVREKVLFPSLAVTFPDSFSFDSSPFFDGFESSFGYLPMIGGTATDDGTGNKVYQMKGTEATFDAVAGMLLGGQMRFETGFTQSCQPFGEPLQITRAEGNLIFEIEGRPAYDIFLEHLSVVEAQCYDEAMQNIFLGLPIRSFQTEFQESQFLVRNIMSVNAQNGMLACVAPVNQGEFLTFAMRDPLKAEASMRGMLRGLKEHFTARKPAFGLYFNCCSRGQSLYQQPNRDVELIREAFPDLPLIGFFTFGEFASLDFVNHLHHYSGSLTLIGEE